MPSLTQQTVRNVGIVYGMTIFTKLLGIISIIILARLLNPSDFGLVGLASIVIGILILFQDIGLGAALIQRTNNINEAANVVFYTTIFLRTMLYIIAFIVAPFAAMFFNESLVTPIIRISSLSLIIESFGAGHTTLLTKDLKFKQLTIIEIICGFVSTVLTIILAFLGFSFWSLVYGSLSASPIRVILWWIISSWRPKLMFNKQIAKEMIGYGKHIFFINLMGFWIKNSDNFTVGKVLGTTQLGAYLLAYKFGLYSATNLSALVGRVMFPTYSKLQGQPEKIRKAYIKTLRPISLLAIPIAFGTIAIAPEFVMFVLGKKWESIIVPLQILSICGLFSSLAGPGWNVFLACGKPHISSKIAAVQLIIILSLIYPFTLWYGLVGVSVVVTLSTIVNALWALIAVCNVINIPYSYILKAFHSPFLSSCIMFLVIMVMKIFIHSTFITFLLLVGIGIVIYFLSLYVITKGIIFIEIKEIWSALK